MYLLPAIPTATVIYAFRQSDGFARVIVFMLLGLSIYAWTIMVEKGLLVRKVQRGNSRFLEIFEKSTAPLELALQVQEHYGPITELYEMAIDEIMDILEVEPHLIETYCRRRTLPRGMTIHEIDRIRTTLERNVGIHIDKLEESLGILGTTVTVSPFLGLLGTVWGVMMAFCGMAQKGRPDIGAIAPGVSGALLTTVVGLIVAIPAVIGFNLIVNGVKKTTVQMESFIDDFVSLLKLTAEEQEQPDIS